MKNIITGVIYRTKWVNASFDKSAKLFSVDQLSKFLLDNGHIKQPLKKVNQKSYHEKPYKYISIKGPGYTSAETYGNKSFVYVDFGTTEKRKKAESDLSYEDVPVNKKYDLAKARSEIPVKFFKGYQWWQ